MIASSILEQEYIQYGFAGFSFILLGIVIWLIALMLKNGKEQNDKLVTVIEKSNSWTAKLIDAIKAIGVKEDHSKESAEQFRTETKASFKELGDKLDELHKTVLSKPCIKD